MNITNNVSIVFSDEAMQKIAEEIAETMMIAGSKFYADCR